MTAPTGRDNTIAALRTSVYHDLTLASTHLRLLHLAQHQKDSTTVRAAITDARAHLDSLLDQLLILDQPANKSTSTALAAARTRIRSRPQPGDHPDHRPQ